MRLQFKINKQKKFLKETKQLTNYTWKELAQFLEVNSGTLKNWTKESRCLPGSIYEKIINQYPQLKFYDNYVVARKDDHWGQIKGGIRGSSTVSKKLKTNPEFRSMWIKNSKKGGRNNIRNGLIKNWAVGFRNIGRRRFIGPRKEKMFTEAEKILAEFFVKNRIEYEYEPLITIGKKTYFPDFLINGNVIIERCAVISTNYFLNLQSKLNNYKKINKKVILIFPKKYRNVFFRNVKIPKKFICLIEDNNLKEVTETLKEVVIWGSSSSLV